MARATHRISAAKLRTLTKPGRHVDGDGLSLVIAPTGARRWSLRFRLDGKQREIGLGSADGPRAVSLAEARAKARDAQAALKKGEAPTAQKPIEGTGPTFGEVADAWLTLRLPGLRNEKHRAQVEATLGKRPYNAEMVRIAPQAHEAHVSGLAAIREKPVAEVSVDDVLGVIGPIWHEQPETARRIRQRIEAVLSAAKARGLRSGENPAAWRDNLVHLLPAPPKGAKRHHAALPWTEAPQAWAKLRAVRNPAVSHLGLMFVILTWCRTGEAIGARWNEIDLQAALWTIPAERMKAGRPHRVALSEPAVAILQDVARLRPAGDDGSAFVFPGQKRGAGLSDMTLKMCSRRLFGSDATVHGWRSTARDWCFEATDHGREVAEAALAHVVGDRVEAAYRRGDALAKRRRLMDDWAAYLAGPASA